MTSPKRRLAQLENTVAIYRAGRLAHKPVPTVEQAWRDYDIADSNLEGAIEPWRYNGESAAEQQPREIDAEVALDCMCACGSALVRAWARLIELGELTNVSPKASDADLVREMIAHALQLDVAHTPDLSAYAWDARTYATDEQGQHVFDSDTLWTWQDRLEAARRFELRTDKRYGFNMTSEISFMRQRR